MVFSVYVLVCIYFIYLIVPSIIVLLCVATLCLFYPVQLIFERFHSWFYYLTLWLGNMDQLFKIIIFMWIYFDRTSCFCCCNFCVILVTGLLIFICFSNIDEGNRLETSLSGNSYWYCFISKVLILAKNGYLKVFHSIRYFAHHWFLLTTVAPCRVHLAMFSTYFYYALVVFFSRSFQCRFLTLSFRFIQSSKVCKKTKYSCV